MTSLPSRRIWGKLIGGIVGLLIGGGLPGALIGILIGHMYDKRHDGDAGMWAQSWGNPYDFAATAAQASFTMGVVVLGAKMAKADGRVTRAEIEAFKRVFHITPIQEKAVGTLFDRARRSAEGFEPYAFQLAKTFQHNAAVLEEILSGLFIIAASDTDGLSPAEVMFLKRVAYIFGFDAENFARIAARSGVGLPERQKPHNPVQEAFAILGVAETATAEEIKTAYRSLIREHHPDKLMAQGMPPEFVATATEKMKRINVAYDTVSRIKGIK